MQRVKRLGSIKEAEGRSNLCVWSGLLHGSGDVATAQALEGRFVEAIIAPGYVAGCVFFSQKKNLRILKLKKASYESAPQTMVKQINGGCRCVTIRN